MSSQSLTIENLFFIIRYHFHSRSHTLWCNVTRPRSMYLTQNSWTMPSLHAASPCDPSLIGGGGSTLCRDRLGQDCRGPRSGISFCMRSVWPVNEAWVTPGGLQGTLGNPFLRKAVVITHCLYVVQSRDISSGDASVRDK
jgi:hypothetical protein